MKLFGFDIRREVRASPEDPRVPISASNFLQFFGQTGANLPAVTIDSALQVPAVSNAVNFLSRTLANIPMHAYKRGEDGPERIDGKLETVIHENPNPYQDSVKFRQYFWAQVFTGGRGLAWIERKGREIEAIWPLNPADTVIKRNGLRLIYQHGKNEYLAEDVLDVPFMLKADQTGHFGPIQLASRAIQLALAMNDYASQFFAGGGVPPLALVGPMPAGAEAVKRAQADVKNSIDAAKKDAKQIFPIPSGYELKPVGFDPEKGQMTDARRFQILEIARAYQLPPVFLQDFSDGVKANAEQQDLHLVKHVISQWVGALEGEMNLKLFGRMNSNRYVEHNIDGLLRGDFKTRMEGYSAAIQHGVMTPDEAREKEGRQKMEGGDKLFMQGAMLPIDMLGTQQGNGGTPPQDQNGGA